LRRRFKRESALPGPLICEAVTQKQDKIMYTKKMFGTELKERVLKKQDITEIGHWAYWIYLEYIKDIDLDFREILLTLNGMEDGPEFAFTYEELNQIADNLIAGKDVKL
jgi:hypothetical protein